LATLRDELSELWFMVYKYGLPYGCIQDLNVTVRGTARMDQMR
jgi:hypothetical protein